MGASCRCARRNNRRYSTGAIMAKHNDTSPEGRSVRVLRVGEQVRHILSDILMRGDVHDDVLAKHQVSVTEVRMSPDLRHATVFVKPLLGKDEEVVLKALRTNTAYLQREVATRVKMKYAAKLKFLADESFDEGTHIDQLLRDPKVARDLDDADTDEV
ncbi:30S ribosome-binding factor RbfA [Pseudonocardia sp. TMWB2A]|uniref:30S ribosome-binding factor RbfA n=1 Tax=Pseudonocardia sp. TMWB2A TaxID=687430 RepID=UPI00307E7438